MMHRKVSTLVMAALALATGLGAAAVFGREFYSNGGRADFYADGDGAQARNVPDLVVVTRVPGQFDPATQALSVTCSLLATDADFAAVSNVKARYKSTLETLDPVAGTYSSRKLGSGKTRTGDPGEAFVVSAEPPVVPGGVQDGATLLVETVFKLKTKKVVTTLTALCDVGLQIAP